MDAFDIALLMANQDTGNPLKMRYGTVVAVDDSDRIPVMPDGQVEAVSALRCCRPNLEDHVIMPPYEVFDIWIRTS
ncbi:MAG: hypothetical protein RR842_07030 [Gordonibacter sp.]|uniref:hypothetical protein n=1 Tax=Gordonibacter sp. TaxID=1968902 RepID=UPI002FCC4215